jgi:hypothetical protein
VKPALGLPPLVLDGKPYGTMIYARCSTSKSIDPNLLRSIPPTRARRPSDASVDPIAARSLGKGDEMYGPSQKKCPIEIDGIWIEDDKFRPWAMDRN